MGKHKNPNYFSANSNNLRKSRIYGKMGVIPVIMLVIVSLWLMTWIYHNYEYIMDPSLAKEIKQSNGPSGTTEIDSLANDQINPANPGPSAVPPSELPTTASASNSPGVVLPAEVITIIDSLEKDGIKKSPYASLNTTSIPDDTIIKMDRNSWVQHGNDAGTVSGIATSAGKSSTGSISFQYIYGSWKITGYIIDL